ncbi:TPA: DUF2815 family protein [Clostridioides difficile]|uniref:DUF2815 family protein n=1 Tax=Clostridioides difficile TaxID=1496 RepID=UPI00097FE72E|nr:DUF2815 family protein [Clostridioides difficile]MDI6117374.1 DUF2815 family protein [Clostridioides difficile]MDI6117459.1 DUF2815 family protein [Clostridioides difficile]SJP69070.1 Protein of uncharacterised function (DUF2815) [Clostridioides difficile]HBH1809414.1 DUF2815 family protein [Clostridioides difficile]HEK4895297.1 DUF2815 family protein [Clostridioides difficile]
MSNSVQSTKVVTGKVRLSYCNIFKSRAMVEGAEPKYSVCILIPKSDKVTLGRIKKAIDAAKEQGKTSKWGGKLPGNLKTPLRDGDAERADEAEEYVGMCFLNANSTQKPGIVDKDLNEILDNTEVYSGCYGRVSINFFPYNSAGNKGIGCGLQNVQKLADGEVLGGARASAEADFSDDFEYEDEEEDFLS